MLSCFTFTTRGAQSAPHTKLKSEGRRPPEAAGIDVTQLRGGRLVYYEASLEMLGPVPGSSQAVADATRTVQDRRLKTTCCWRGCRASRPLEVFEADEKGDLDGAEAEEAGSSLRGSNSWFSAECFWDLTSHRLNPAPHPIHDCNWLGWL